MAGARLSRATRDRLPAELTRDLPTDGTGIGIVHLGVGAFHRAHQAVLTQRAMAVQPGDWAICAVAPRSRTVVDQLRPQDGLYTVTERGADGDRPRLVGAIGAVIAAAEEPDRLAAAVAAPTTHVVSLTVTEAGHRHDPRTGRLRAGDPEVRADAAGRPPRTAIGQLVRGLQARCHAEGTPLTVLSCDNLPDNGALLRRLVASFCAMLPEREGTPLWAWVRDHVTFPATVVDQIVPATTPEDRERAARALGLTDAAAVVAEPHREWIIEDAFAGPRPAWDRVGARLVRDARPHQTAKLRCVNGAHSALAHLGLLLGIDTVARAVRHPGLRRYVEELERRELGPSLAGHGVCQPDPERLLERFANPGIGHRLAQIVQLGPQKLPQRLLEPASELARAGREPRLTCLAIAAWIRLLSPEPTSASTTTDRLSLDPASQRIREELASCADPRAAVAAAGRHVPGLADGGDGADLRGRVVEALGELVADGTERALARATG